MDSDDYTTDDGNRKRSREEDERSLARSNKTYRTPTKTYNKQEDKLDKMIMMMTQLSTQVNDLNQEIQNIRREQADLANVIKMVRTENEEIRAQNVKIHFENQKMKEEIRKINDKVEKMERDKRENNVVITGLDMRTDDPKTMVEDIEKFLKKELSIEVTVKAAKKIRNNICLVELNKKEDKMEILKNKNKLKNYGQNNVFINRDMTRKEREINARIRKIAREEKNKGRNIRVGYNKLMLDDRQYVWDKDKDELVEIIGRPKN